MVILDVERWALGPPALHAWMKSAGIDPAHVSVVFIDWFLICFERIEQVPLDNYRVFPVASAPTLPLSPFSSARRRPLALPTLSATSVPTPSVQTQEVDELDSSQVLNDEDLEQLDLAVDTNVKMEASSEGEEDAEADGETDDDEIIEVSRSGRPVRKTARDTLKRLVSLPGCKRPVPPHADRHSAALHAASRSFCHPSSRPIYPTDESHVKPDKKLASPAPLLHATCPAIWTCARSWARCDRQSTSSRRS